MSTTLQLGDTELLEFMGNQEGQFMAGPSYFRERVKPLLDESEGILEGDVLPWRKTMQKFRMRPGELTIWGGVNGHGKSLVTGMVACWLLEATKVCVASLEMKPEKTIKRMLRQSAGTYSQTEQYYDRWESATDGALWIYDQLDTVKGDRILAMCHYAAVKLGCRHIFIDSLMKCGYRKEDYDGTVAFVDRLTWIAKKYSIHIHLVHHMRKGSRESEMPDKFDVRGASEVVDMADNLVIVHRNKSKESKLERGQEVEPLEPDCRLKIAKQRHGEWEGEIALYHHGPSLQYLSGPDSRTMLLNLDKARAVSNPLRAVQ